MVRVDTTFNKQECLVLEETNKAGSSAAEKIVGAVAVSAMFYGGLKTYDFLADGISYLSGDPIVAISMELSKVMAKVVAVPLFTIAMDGVRYS